MKEFRDILLVVGPPTRPIDAPKVPDTVDYQQIDTVPPEFRWGFELERKHGSHPLPDKSLDVVKSF